MKPLRVRRIYETKRAPFSSSAASCWFWLVVIAVLAAISLPQAPTHAFALIDHRSSVDDGGHRASVEDIFLQEDDNNVADEEIRSMLVDAGSFLVRQRTLDYG